MSDYLLVFMIVLALIAAVLRADFVLTVIYLLIGVLAVGRWWTRKALEGVQVRRSFGPRAFLGERMPVRLEVTNAGWLPVVYLQMRESLPVELKLGRSPSQVVTLAPHGRLIFEYSVQGQKRGYYPIGPLSLFSGDLFGVAGELQRIAPPDYLTIYPKIIPLKRVTLPSHSPLGTLRHSQPIFEDPTRVQGKRDYMVGDSLRRVDWKATAASGRLQVKLFEPSIALETAIFLNLNSRDFELRHRFDSPELAIVVAASLANWLIGIRQSVGLVTNGLDPLGGEPHALDAAETPGSGRGNTSQPVMVPARKGRSHLMRILEVLARIQLTDSIPLPRLLRQEAVRMSWGMTLILITPIVEEELFDELFQARRSGLNIVLIVIGPLLNSGQVRQRAEYFGFPIFQILTEQDLDLWRR